MAAGVRVWLVPHDFSKLELRNAVIQILSAAPSTPTTAQVYYDSTLGYLRVWSGSAWHRASFGTDPYARANHTGTQLASTISDLATTVQAYRLDQFAAPTAAVSLNSQRITNLATPTAATDAATKAYVDSAVNGLDWKASVRAATTTAGTLATSFENGDTIDGVVLATGDRILVKDQATASQNGIYVVAASGSPARAADADANAEVTSGLAVFVEEGTANGNQQWVLTTDNPITVGTTNLTFAQVGAQGGAPTAGGGLTLASNTYAVGAGTGIIVNADDVAIDTSVVMRRFSSSFGDGTSTSFTITHNLGTRDVLVQAYDNTSPWGEVGVDVEHTSTTTVTLRTAAAPTNNQYRVVVIG